MRASWGAPSDSPCATSLPTISPLPLCSPDTDSELSMLVFADSWKASGLPSSFTGRLLVAAEVIMLVVGKTCAHACGVAEPRELR